MNTVLYDEITKEKTFFSCKANVDEKVDCAYFFHLKSFYSCISFVLL